MQGEEKRGAAGVCTEGRGRHIYGSTFMWFTVVAGWPLPAFNDMERAKQGNLSTESRTGRFQDMKRPRKGDLVFSLAIESLGLLAMAAAGSPHLHHSLEVLLPAEGAFYLCPVAVAGRDGDG